MAVEHGIGLVVVDNADDVDRLEATVPAGRSQDVLVRIIPGVTADTHAHVLTGHEGSKFGLSPRRRGPADPADRAQPAAADAGAARPRRFADPRRRAVRRVGRAGRARSASSRSTTSAAGWVPGTRWADQPPPVGAYLDALIGAAREHLPGGGPADHRARAQHGRRRRRRRSTGSRRSSAARSRSSRSTAAWATTSRSRCSTSGSRPVSSAGSPGPRRRR